MKNWHIAMQHIKENLGSVCIIMLELAIVMGLSASFVGRFSRLVQTEQLYQQLQLSQVAEVKEENIFSLTNSIQVLNDEKRTISVDYQGNIFSIQSASAEYFSYFTYPLCDGTMPDANNTSVIQGVFPDALKNYFQVGKTYTVYADRETLEVLMVGQMKGNYMYQNNREIRQNKNTILVYDGGGHISKPVSNATVTVFVKDPSSLTAEQNHLLLWVSEMQGFSNAINRFQMGTPFVMSILLLALGIATFAGYNFMQTLQKEKNYGVYYLCGATWKDCIKIQLLVDVITIGIPFFVMIIFLYIYDIFQEPVDSLMSLEGFSVISGICFVVFLFTSLEGILRLRKKSPIAIIERWNHT